jgi:hypothetical protein
MLALDQALLTLLVMLVIVVPSMGCGLQPVFPETASMPAAARIPFLEVPVTAVCTVCVRADTMALAVA